MRSAVRQTLAYFVSLTLLVAPVWSASSAPLGVVTAAERGHISSVQAATGSTIFDGDTLWTDLQGLLRVRAAAAQFQLFASSSAAVTQTPTGIRATLRSGTLALSTANAGAIEIHASKARIRPQGNGPTQAQVTLVSPKELLVTARSGALEITVDDETQIVPEAASYRVLIDFPDPQEPRGAGTKQPEKHAKHSGRSRFILIPLILIGGVTAIAIHEAWESPSRP